MQKKSKAGEKYAQISSAQKKKQDQGKPLPSITSILNEFDGGNFVFCFDFFCDDEVCFFISKSLQKCDNR